MLKTSASGAGSLLTRCATTATAGTATGPGLVRNIQTSVPCAAQSGNKGNRWNKRRGSSRQATTKVHRPAIWERFQIVELAKPNIPINYPANTASLWQACPKEQEDEETYQRRFQPDPLEMLYTEELRRHLEESPMVAVFQGLSMELINQRKNFQMARRNNFEYKKYSVKTTQEVLVGSKWENLAHFTKGSIYDCHFAFSRQLDLNREPLPDAIRLEPRPADLLNFIKKSTDLVFLCVMVHGRIIDKAQLQNLSTMPSIDVLRGELVSILGSPAAKTSSLLGASPQKLSIQLEQYIKDQSPNSDTATSG